ncbi:NAD(P)-binding protein [Trichodelitschia bisporula]|uniref:L-gulonate 3-dehydrogenase n=1 Tax=Trichodelitschia bisporula TaxID=703511 RepID=A0A6G1IAG5_9PEZI|nr:NAD(P)-binding protein [Trichodelitschia bisporula]
MDFKAALEKPRITLIGAGTIGLSFAAFHLTHSPPSRITIHDTRPDLQAYLSTTLPQYLPVDSDATAIISQLNLSTTDATLPAALQQCDIVQEQGPESASFKTALWPVVEAHAPPTAIFWSSTSGIPASTQSVNMRDAGRLLVVHPYNPPHIMPLLELVPSPATHAEVIKQTVELWRAWGREPVVLKKECVGFVANRLAFALLREAMVLAEQGVADVQDIDRVVESSMGPRWAVWGPFKSYAAGGGEGGFGSFMEKIGGTTVQDGKRAGEEIDVSGTSEQT